jgi:hypothetical protein
MSQDTQDILIGAAILVPALILIFLAGKVLYKFKAARFVKAWAPLVPIIDGTVVNDGGGAATSWLTGTFQGRKVQASMVPNRNRYSGQTGHRYNYFDIELQDVPGQQDWSTVHRTALLIGVTGWSIETEDKSLEQRLTAAGLVDRITLMRPMRVAYDSKRRTLLFTADVTPAWAPTPERFTQQLEFMLALVQMNAELNAT